jgi:hypothetical protein
MSASSPIEKPMVANSPMATNEIGGAFRSIFIDFLRLVGCPKGTERLLTRFRRFTALALQQLGITRGT